VLYLDFKNRPIGEYNTERKNLDIFLIASISIAAKALGEYRTDQEFESKLFVRKEKLADAEDRLLKSFQVQNNIMPLPELVSQLAKRQIESMTDEFVEHELIGNNEREELFERSIEILEMAMEKGFNPKTTYRGRAASVVLLAVQDLDLHVSELDIAKAAGFDKKSMVENANIISNLLTKHIVS
jgi:transcription initiation factor TFIIIB Brf1 subunit/transcription initiation factor TFIIB